MTATLLLVLGWAAIQRHQDRQRPGSGGKRKLDQDRQHHPLVPVAVSGIGVRRAYGVAMQALAEDLLAAMFVDGVVARQPNRAGRREAANDPGGQEEAQTPQRPASFGEDAMVTGRRSRQQGTECAEQIQHRMVAHSQDSREQQDQDAVVGGAGEHRSKGLPEGADGRRSLRFEPTQLLAGTLLRLALASALASRELAVPAGAAPGYTGHKSLLARKGRFLATPSIPSRRLVFV